MAPSTPPPPRSSALAAFTIASTASLVMSPWTISIIDEHRAGDDPRLPLRAEEPPRRAPEHLEVHRPFLLQQHPPAVLLDLAPPMAGHLDRGRRRVRGE